MAGVVELGTCKGCSALCEDYSGVHEAESDTVEEVGSGTVEKAGSGTVERAGSDAVEESIGCSEATEETQDPLAILRYVLPGCSRVHDQTWLAVVQTFVAEMAVRTFHSRLACCVVTL